MARYFTEICCNLNKAFSTDNERLSCTTPWLSDLNRLPGHPDWCVYTHASIVSHHLGKNIIAKWLARERKQKQEPGFEDWKEQGICAKLALQQRTLRWCSIGRWCPSCSVQLLYKANVHCLQELTGRPVKAVCNGFRGRNLLSLPKGFLWMQPEIFQRSQLLCMFFSTFWETSHRERHQGEESQYGAQ